MDPDRNLDDDDYPVGDEDNRGASIVEEDKRYYYLYEDLGKRPGKNWVWSDNQEWCRTNYDLGSQLVDW